MNKPNVASFIQSTQAAITKHSPEILVGIGIAGMVTTTVLAVRATPKALRLIEEKKRLDHLDDLTPLETVKAAWKPYIPAVVTGVTSIVCLIGGSSVSARRNAALATAYKLSETALAEYKEKVVETIGEKKEKLIRDEINKDRIEANPASKTEVIMTGKGDTLCYDAHGGRYFKSDIDRINKAVNELNRRMLLDSYVSLNDFYDELGLEHTRMGYDLGWKIDDGFIKVDFSSHLADDGTPCLAIDYYTAPKYDYSKFL